MNDRLTGSVAAIELLQNLIEVEADSRATSFFTQLKSDIEADQQELKALIQRLGVRESAPRKAAAWVAGKMAQTTDPPVRCGGLRLSKR